MKNKALTQRARTLGLSALGVALALLAFQWLGPAPQRAADLAGARAIGATAARVVVDQATCPETARASMEKRTGADLGPAVPARCIWGANGLRVQALAAADAGDSPALIAVPRPGPSSLVGPLLAVALVLGLGRPALGLLLAVIGASLVLVGPIDGMRHSVVEVFAPTLASRDNQLVLLFTATMLGMVQVAVAGGGFAALARRISGDAGVDRAKAARRTRMSTWLLGLGIFFDDYANALVVGSSMRPLADRTGVSRAKLAFLVDATSAAVAGMAIVSTWVGFEVGLLGDLSIHFGDLTGAAAGETGEAAASSGYAIFLALVPYRFYCFSILALAGLIAWSGRDFGPMLRAERRMVLEDGDQGAAAAAADSGAEGAHWLDAVLPVGSVLAGVIGIDLWLGRAAEGGALARFIAGAEAGGLATLCAAGLFGSVLAISLARMRGTLTIGAASRAWARGIVSMGPIFVILVAAMSMRVVTEAAGTPVYLAALVGSASGPWLPVVSFLTAGLVAFLTGSSWATMGILLPIVVPLGGALVAGGGHIGWLLAAAAGVLDGAIFGDHCSPISDTTVMSSAASGCPHDEHVRTQLPYALAAMLVAALVGYVATAWLEWPAWTAWPATLGLLVALVYGFGRVAADQPDPVDGRESARS